MRNYSGEPVAPETIQRMLEVARKAPSAGFSQGHYFVVVREQTTRSAIAALADEPSYVAAGLDPWISSAPVHVAVCVREADYHERYREPDKLGPDGQEMEWPVPYWWVDSGGALMLLLLAAVNEGLAAGLCGFHRLDGLRELLGIPEDVTPIGIVTLGHPAPDRRSSSLARGWKSYDEVVFEGRWGGSFGST